MKVSIFGLGYVGVVTAACLARDGHSVIGVDVNAEKVALIAAGRSPIVEPGLDDLIRSGVASGRITATTDHGAAVLATDVSMISVGTPPAQHGQPNLDFVVKVCHDIGAAIKRKGSTHVVVLRSTVPPGTLERCEAIIHESAGGVPVHLAFNPEFLREGAAIRDYKAPPFTVIGTEDPDAEAALRMLYASIDAQVIVVKPAAAEMIKYVANTWHAVKITFANEIGRMAKAFGVDGREVMDVFVQDTKLNVSPVYFRPGFAYGGSCLPKDVGSLLYHAREASVALPLLSGLPVSNAVQIDMAVEEALRTGARRIAVLGLAFKPDTDDLRESPAVPLVKRLLGEGCQVRIYDRAVYEARLMGTNLEYIRRNLPHFEQLLVANPSEALEGAELIIATHGTAEMRGILEGAPRGVSVLDVAGMFRTPPEGMDYRGLAW